MARDKRKREDAQCHTLMPPCVETQRYTEKTRFNRFSRLGVGFIPHRAWYGMFLAILLSLFIAPIHADTNPIANGDFGVGNESWWYTNMAGEMTFTFNEMACVKMSDAGINPWDVQLGQNEVQLLIGQRYRVKMTVVSDVDRPFSFRVYGSAPWETYTHPTYQLISGVNEIEHLFTMSANDTNTVFALHLGGYEAGTLCIDDIVITQAATPVEVEQTSRGTAPEPLPEQPDYGIVTPHLWPNGAQAALSLTFDDGTYTHFETARPILNAHNFPATFYINNGSTVNLDRAGTWAQFEQMSAEGHEIGSHTWTHQRLTDMPTGDINTPLTVHHELQLMRLDIETHIPDKEVISFAYPFTETNAEVIELMREYHLSARSADGEANPAENSAINWYKLSAWAAEYGKPRRSTADDVLELDAMKSYIIGTVQRERAWGILLFHEIVPFNQLATNDSWHPTSSEFLENLTNWLVPLTENNHLWIATVGDVTRYVKERDTLQSRVIETFPDRQFRIYVTDGLDDDIFDLPVTVDITVPDNWDGAHIFQGQTYLGESVTANGAVTAEIVPDGGLITVGNRDFAADDIRLPGTPLNIGLYVGILLPIFALFLFGGLMAWRYIEK